MKQITKTYTVYSFDELSETAKQKALDKLYDINVMDEWWETTFDDAEQIGLKLTEFDIDRANFCRGDFALSAHEVAANIISNHGDMCETYKTAQSFLDTVNKIQSKYDDFEGEEYESEMIEAEDEFKNSLLEDYLVMLRNEYGYMTSKDAIIETIEANEYTFLEDGTMKNF